VSLSSYLKLLFPLLSSALHKPLLLKSYLVSHALTMVALLITCLIVYIVYHFLRDFSRLYTMKEAIMSDMVIERIHKRITDSHAD
jgi:hypothetical protein